MIGPTNALTVTCFLQKKRAVRRAAPDKVGSQPLHAVLKRPNDKRLSVILDSTKKRAPKKKRAAKEEKTAP